jgi:protein HOOK3
VAAIDQDEIDAIEDLKATNEIITSSLNNDLQLLQTRHKNLITDYDQQRAHLVDALLDRENLRKEIETARKGRLATAPELVENDLDAAKEEKAKATLQSLKEVSRERYLRKEKQPAKKGVLSRFTKALFSRSKNPYIPKPEHHKFPVPSDKETLQVVELAYERQAIGTLQRAPSPDIPPDVLPLPQSPASIRYYPQDVYRSQTNP